MKAERFTGDAFFWCTFIFLFKISDFSFKRWLKEKAKDDNVEDLWRIHDTLYDFSDFVHFHPGGESWLRLTKGSDITELFETHHLSSIPEKLLEKYKVSPSKTARNIKLTFYDDGFYKTLKGRVREVLKDIDIEKHEAKSKAIIDTLLILTLVSAVATALSKSHLLATLSGLLITWTVIAAHNFLHKKDNWRMKLFNLGMLTYKEARVFHAMSHHMYPNTYIDYEMLAFEPILNWLPDATRKAPFLRLLSRIYEPVVFTFSSINEFAKRFRQFSKHRSYMHKDDFILLIIPAIMILANPSNALIMLYLWFYMTLVNSFTYMMLGLNAGHHHPEIVHAGDFVP
jgi:cytochrome b involved in lipid metabolism